MSRGGGSPRSPFAEPALLRGCRGGRERERCRSRLNGAASLSFGSMSR